LQEVPANEPVQRSTEKARKIIAFLRALNGSTSDTGEMCEEKTRRQGAKKKLAGSIAP
jgi:hypothetical protein